MRSRLLLATLIALCLAVTGSAWAICTQVEGQITAIDAPASQLTLATPDGSVVVQVTPDTVIKMGATQLAFADLKVGMTTRVCGAWQDDVLVANSINVRFQGK